tara:strand:+ start:423 stop:704 length:282 start_codon:yes stop_codon:yes gene_type:complete
MKFYPKNRHLLIKTVKSVESEEPSVLLPEGYALPKDKYVLATVLDNSNDCKENYSQGSKVVVDSCMVETVVLREGHYEIVLENHIVGILSQDS